MRAMILSIRPEWVAKILNGEKTIEIRKKFPADYVGWVYIYCTKGKPYIFSKWQRDLAFWQEKDIDKDVILNGKVVARFWCDMVGIFDKKTFGTYENYYNINQQELLENSCLTEKQLDDYLQGKNGYAIHISKLEVFEKPRELNEFKTFYKTKMPYENEYLPIKYAPQKYVYVEELEI